MSHNSADSSNPSYFEYPDNNIEEVENHDSELSHLFHGNESSYSSELPGIKRRRPAPVEIEAGEEVNQPVQQAVEDDVIVISSDEEMEEEVAILPPLDRHVQRWRVEEVEEIVEDYMEQRQDADLMAAVQLPPPQFPPAMRHRRAFSF